MTDKELRKLSRLELLELLLEESKENEQLRETLSAKPAGGEIDPSVFAGMEKVATRLEDAITRLDGIATAAPKAEEAPITAPPQPTVASPVYQPPVSMPYQPSAIQTPPKGVYEGGPRQSDAWLFHSIMHYFYKNEELLMYLPEDISREIRVRLRGNY